MKSVLRFAAVVGVLAFAASVHAADVTGTWKGSFDLQGTNVPVVFHLTAAATGVTGTLEGIQPKPVEIHDGKVDAGTLTFWINTDYEGTTYKVVFKGKVSEGQIEFEFGTEEGSWGTTMTAKKAEDAVVKPSAPDVSGTWKGAFDFQGTNVPLTFHLKSAAGVVTGTVEGLPATPSEIHDGKQDGDTITFTVLTEYQGSPVKLVYKGTISADGIKFTFGTEDGSWGTELTATKSS